jgi:hypothetical protein
MAIVLEPSKSSRFLPIRSDQASIVYAGLPREGTNADLVFVAISLRVRVFNDIRDALAVRGQLRMIDYSPERHAICNAHWMLLSMAYRSGQQAQRNNYRLPEMRKYAVPHTFRATSDLTHR